MMDIMLLAAGLGTRMRPLSETCPKPLLRVGKNRLIEHHLFALARADARRVIVNTAHLAEQIEGFLGTGARYGLEIIYSRETDGPCGTAGGIARASKFFENELLLVINSDIYTDFQFDLTALAAVFEDKAIAGHLVLVPNPPHHPHGDFCLRGKLAGNPHTSASPADTLTFSGIGIYRTRQLLRHIGDRADLGAVLRTLAGEMALSAETHEGIWLDAGTPERLREVREIVRSL